VNDRVYGGFTILPLHDLIRRSLGDFITTPTSTFSDLSGLVKALFSQLRSSPSVPRHRGPGEPSFKLHDIGIGSESAPDEKRASADSEPRMKLNGIIMKGRLGDSCPRTYQDNNRADSLDLPLSLVFHLFTTNENGF